MTRRPTDHETDPPEKDADDAKRSHRHDADERAEGRELAPTKGKGIKPREDLPPPEMTRIYLTGDDLSQLIEAEIPTAEFGFRIFMKATGPVPDPVNAPPQDRVLLGQHFEQVGEAADGTRIFAPTR